MAICASGCLLPGEFALAAISGADGRVETSVQQFNASTGQVLDQAAEETPGTTNILPAAATAALEIAQEDVLQGGLSATAAVHPPPDVASVENIRDFSIEAEGLSLLPDRGFTCTAKATENRRIVFGAEELALRTGTAIRVRSTFALSAGVFLITLPDSAGDIQGTVHFILEQQDANGSRVLLDGAVQIDFGSDGRLRIAGSGNAADAFVLPFDLSGRSTRVERAHLALLPLLSLPYEYDAIVDVPFTLTARVDARVTAPTGGQGGSAFIGQMPIVFLDTIDNRLQVDLSDAVGGTAESVNAHRAVGLAASQTEIIPKSAPGRCGGFGLEALLGLVPLTMTLVWRRFA